MNKFKKIAFLTKDDPMDKRSWSGIYFRMINALQKEFEEIIPIGPIKLPIIEFILKIFQLLILIIFKKKYNRTHSILLSQTYGFILKRKLQKKNIDAIFAPSASNLIAYLKTDIPIFYYADATVNSMTNYYDCFTNLINFSLNESNKIERIAIKKARASIFASEWAAKDAITNYNSKIKNTFVIKMGANIEKAPQSICIEEKLNQKVCNLLFLGIDWKRKGGDIVYKTLDLLIQQGFDTHLVICGCTPPLNHPNMTVYPFLNKNLESDYKTFTNLLQDAHFLFLPTRAECAGIVFCEAAANGIPSISTDTGGVSSYVLDGISGFTLPLTSTHEEYAKLIKSTFENKELYRKLSYQSRNEYFDELNWDIWARKINETISNSTE